MARFEEVHPPFHPFGSRTLHSGEQGTDVAVLQTIYNQLLQVTNPPQGPIGDPIPVTAIYDAATARSVKRVQAYFHVASDGVAGPDTFFLFGVGVGPHVTFGGPHYGSRPLSQGQRGGDVTVLQNRLSLFRYSTTLNHPADGVFGPTTIAAVGQFQTDAGTNGDHGVPITGVTEQATFDATWIYTCAGGRGIFTGRNGYDVAFLQALLAHLGTYHGPVHGLYDGPTRQAVMAFQASAGLTADGVVGPSTFHALGRRNPAPAPAPLPVPPVA